MNFRILLFVSLGIMLIATGCNTSPGPTSPLAVPDGNQLRNAPAQIFDDTKDSDIVLDPYPTITIAAIGDSITAGAGSSSRVGGYPGALETRLNAEGYKVVVQNEGIHGADSATADYYFQRSVRGADIALIMIGTNDISCPSCCTQPYNCRTIDHIRSMVHKAQISGIMPILGTVTPKKPRGVYGFYNPAIEALNQRIYQLGAESQVQVVDTYTPILENGADALFVDKHHLNDQGYMILAEAWYNTLINFLFKPLL